MIGMGSYFRKKLIVLLLFRNNLKRQDGIEDLSNTDAKKEEKRTIGYSLNNNPDNTQDANQNPIKEIIVSSNDDKDLLLNNFIGQDKNLVVNDDNAPYEQNNPNLKLEGNLSFVDDDFEAGDEENLESEKFHASINQYKEKFMGSVNGMSEFKEFLKHTNGYRLVKFWLDCEFYRDSMQDYDDIENMATRNRLFR